MSMNEMFGMNSVGFFFLIIIAFAALMLSVLAKNKARKGIGLIALAVVIQVFFHGSTIDISVNGYRWINIDSVIFFITICIQIIGIVMVLYYGGLLESKKRQVARQRYEAIKKTTVDKINENVSPEINNDEIQIPSFMVKRVPTLVHRKTMKEKIFGLKNPKINPKEC